MNLVDKDLASIQEARDLLRRAKLAQKVLSKYNQKRIDEIVEHLTIRAYESRTTLAKLAFEETGFGKWEDKVVKNIFASKGVYEYIKNMRTIGVLKEDPEKKITEVAVPVGVIAGLIPSTNPTSTVIFKALISIKAGNSIVFSPHPSALKCIMKTVEILRGALNEIDAPEDLISVLTTPTMEGTEELMKNDLTNLILATGGHAMVKSAYSSGTPAIGVGPGNGPAYIERSANIKLAVKHIMDSKTFDNGTICASEQSIIVEKINKEEVINELKKQGGYLLSKDEADKLAKYILRANGTMNPEIVGKSADHIAKIAGLNVDSKVKLLVAEEKNVGPKHPYSREKLAPIIALYTVENWEEACKLSIEILEQEGAGHTLIIHTENYDIVNEFGLQKPVSRLLVNTPGALGGIGATVNLVPSLTLGCGAVGGSATSDNVGPQNLFNIRRIAHGVLELEDLKSDENDNLVSHDISSEDQEKIIRSIVEQIIKRI